MSDVLPALYALASLRIQIGSQRDREAPQIVALNIFSPNSLHYILNSLLKKAILFIKPVITSKRQSKGRKEHQEEEAERSSSKASQLLSWSTCAISLHKL